SLRTQEYGRIQDARDEAQEVLEALAASLDTDRGRELLKANTETRDTYYFSLEEISDLAFTGSAQRARSRLLGDTIRQQQAAFFVSLDELSAWQDTLMQQAATELDRTINSTQLIMLVVVLVAVLLSILVGGLLTRSIIRQLGGEPEYAATIVGQIAAGNLATAVHTREGDDKSLIASMKAMQQSLVDVVSHVRHDSENVARASAQISQGNHDLASRTTEQAAAIQEIAASMEELSATVRQNADNASQADTLAQTASDIATRGGQMVTGVVDTMQEIDESSQKMLDIINIIDGIA